MELTRSVRRGLSRAFERISARPLSIVVFGASVLALVYLQGSQLGHFQARAVAQAQVVEHPALLSSFVSAVFVRIGDPVEPGAPLAELSPYFIERDLAQIDAKIAQLLHEVELARAELMVDEERWLDEELRRRPSQPSIRRQTDEFYTAQLELLRLRRAQLEEDRSHLTITSQSAGRVAQVVPAGSSVAIGTSVASVSPEYAEEIVAYVPAQSDAALIQPGVATRISQTRMAACLGTGTVLRRGPGVVEAPGQLRGFLRLPVYGLPVYISMPEGCQLGVGQVVSVEFPKAGG